MCEVASEEPISKRKEDVKATPEREGDAAYQVAVLPEIFSGRGVGEISRFVGNCRGTSSDTTQSENSDKE